MAIGKLIFDKEADIWQDAMPLGNGKMGALLFGGISSERIILNHENLWLPVTVKKSLKETGGFLGEVRGMAKRGEYEGISKLWFDHAAVYKKEGLYWPNPFQPGCEIHLEMQDTGEPYDIRRNIDFKTGEGLVSWKQGRFEICRKCFVSRADNVIVYGITSDSPAFIKNMSMCAVPYQGEYAWNKTPVEKLISSNQWCKENYMYFKENYILDQVYGSGYGAMAKIITDGVIITRDRNCEILNFKKTVILMKIFDPQEWQQGIGMLKAGIEDLPVDYEELLDRHVKIHGELFNRCSVNLCPEEELYDKSGEELVLTSRKNSKPSRYLIQLMYEYGRYLIISSTGRLPANLQGVWNANYNPPWQCDYTMDENIQMNYWQVLQGNMPELSEAFFGLFEMQRPEWRLNAEKIFGCKGVLAPIKSTVDALFHHISPDWPWHFWTAGAGWIASLYYDYYMFTNDRFFLKDRVIPFLIEIVDFYSDYLIEDEDGKYSFIIGISPENIPAGRGSMLAPNPAMEIAVAREVFKRLIESCKLLETESGRIPLWEKMFSMLPQYSVNSDGALKEWIHPDYADNYHHRHQSHIYPLFPGFDAIEENNKQLFDACRCAVEKRLIVGLESQTGWSLMHMACIFARLGQAEKAYKCLCLETAGMVGPNLFTYHNKLLKNDSATRSESFFQIDANLGMSAAIQEMLLFSLPGYIVLLPALPDEWPKGSFKGMKARGGLMLDVDWDMEEMQIKIIIISDADQSIKVHLPFCGKIQTGKSEYKYSKETELHLIAGEPFEFSVFQDRDII